MSIRAIETAYKGYRFRSRLEARWAVFFDALGIEWQYEVQGFTNDQGDCYLPDFYLPSSKTWVEVKGDKEALSRDWERMSRLLDFGGVLPDFADSYGSDRGLVVLGDIPDGTQFGVWLHPVIQHRKGLVKSWGLFLPEGFEQLGDLGPLAGLWGIEETWGLECGPADWHFDAVHIRAPRGWREPLEAYVSARSARFEHGEHGALAR